MPLSRHAQIPLAVAPMDLVALDPMQKKTTIFMPVVSCKPMPNFTLKRNSPIGGLAYGMPWNDIY